MVVDLEELSYKWEIQNKHNNIVLKIGELKQHGFNDIHALVNRVRELHCRLNHASANIVGYMHVQYYTRM